MNATHDFLDAAVVMLAILGALNVIGGITYGCYRLVAWRRRRRARNEVGAAADAHRAALRTVQADILGRAAKDVDRDGPKFQAPQDMLSRRQAS